MAKSITVTDTDRAVAKQAIELQATHHGLNLNDPNVRSFVDHMIEVSAADHASIRFYTNCLHKMNGTTGA